MLPYNYFMRFAIVNKVYGIAMLRYAIQLYSWQPVDTAGGYGYAVGGIFVLVGNGAIAPICGQAGSEAKVFAFLPDAEE